MSFMGRNCPSVLSLVVIGYGTGFIIGIRIIPLGLSEIENEAQHIAKKYKDIIIELDALPATKPGETIVRLPSLEYLVKAAEGLLKPVLHKAGYEDHIYCVLDVTIRYEYHLGHDTNS